MLALDGSKATQRENIPTKLIKVNSKFFSNFSNQTLSASLEQVILQATKIYWCENKFLKKIPELMRKTIDQ